MCWALSCWAFGLFCSSCHITERQVFHLPWRKTKTNDISKSNLCLPLSILPLFFRQPLFPNVLNDQMFWSLFSHIPRHLACHRLSVWLFLSAGRINRLTITITSVLIPYCISIVMNRESFREKEKVWSKSYCVESWGENPKKWFLDGIRLLLPD